MAATEPGAEGVSPGTHTLVSGKKALTTVEASRPEPGRRSRRRWRWRWARRSPPREAGGAAPLSYLLGFVGSLCLGFVLINSRGGTLRRASVSRTSGLPSGIPAGFTAGWVYAGAWMFGVGGQLARSPLTRLVALFALHSVTVSWLVFFIPMIVICAGINYIGVKPSVRAQVTLELASMVALAIIMAFVLGKGGAHGLSLRRSTRTIPPRAGAASDTA